MKKLSLLLFISVFCSLKSQETIETDRPDQTETTFTELYGFLNKYVKADHRFDAGFTYLLNDYLMIDASSGFGISEISPQYFLSCGISCRLAAK